MLKDLNSSLVSISQRIMDELNKGQTALSNVQSKLNTIDQVINSGQAILKMVKHVLIAYKQYYQVLNNNTLVLLKCSSKLPESEK